MRKMWEKDFHKPPSPRPWGMNTFELGSAYDYLDNRVALTAGLTHGSFGNPDDRPSYMMWSVFETMIARETIRAFDHLGVRINAKGTMGDLIAFKGAQEAYGRRAACYLRKYDKMEVKNKGETLYLDGKLVADSAMVDRIAVDVAFHAWQRDQKARRKTSASLSIRSSLLTSRCSSL